MVNIACVFRNTVALGDGLTPASYPALLQKYVVEHLAAAWPVTAQLVRSDDFQPGAWGLLFSDDADQAGALGYHDVTPHGTPLGHVFVRTTRRDGDSVSVTATHELAELLCDPACNLGVLSPRNHWVAREVSDPVERETFALDGVSVSDFVYPAWFGEPGARFDHLGRCAQPWQILPGGYVPIMTGDHWTQVFGSTAAGQLWQGQDHRLHRPARRLLAAAGISHTQSLALAAGAAIPWAKLFLLLVQYGPTVLKLLRQVLPVVAQHLPIPLTPIAGGLAGVAGNFINSLATPATPAAPGASSAAS